MDKLNNALIATLKRNGRASISELAAELGVTRATVRARLDSLRQSGEIAGFTVLTRADISHSPVRGLMMLGIEGHGTRRCIQSLRKLSQVDAVHTTNGIWDLIVSLSTETLEDLDEVLFEIRNLDGVKRSETHLLLSTSYPF